MLWFSATSFWACSSCGYVGSGKAHNLQLQCTKVRTSFGETSLKRLTAGQLPYHAARALSTGAAERHMHRQQALVSASNFGNVRGSSVAQGPLIRLTDAQSRLQAIHARVKARCALRSE
eukprot:4598225-Karenia_brevis.AAC.1